MNAVTKELSRTISAGMNEKFIIVKDEMRLYDKLELLKKRSAILNSSLIGSFSDISITSFINLCNKIGLNIDHPDILLKYETYTEALSNITYIPIYFGLNSKLFSPALLYLKTHITWYTYLDNSAVELSSIESHILQHR